MEKNLSRYFFWIQYLSLICQRQMAHQSCIGNFCVFKKGVVMAKNEVIFRSDQYYQGILQLRPRNKEIIDFAIAEIKRNKQGELSKLVETKSGFDLYLTSNVFLITLGAKLKKKFRGTLKKSRMLYGKNRMTSREVYRVTLCFRLQDDK